MGKEAFAKGIKVTDAELKARYERDMDEFREPRKIKAAHILVSHKDDKDKAKKKAEELLGRIKKARIFLPSRPNIPTTPVPRKRAATSDTFR